MAITYNPNMMTKGAKATFIEAVMQTSSVMLETVATYITSDSYSEDFGWIGEAPSFEEFKDEVRFKAMSDATYQLANIKYTAGIEVSRDDINDEKVGGLGLRISEVGQRAASYTDFLLSTGLKNGTSTTLGTHIHAGAFFRTDHPARASEGGTQSNLLTGTGTTVAQIQTDVGSALSAMMGFLGEDGHPVNMGFRSVAIETPVDLYFLMTEAMEAAIISQTTNVRFKRFTIEVSPNPYLDGDSKVDYYVGIVDTPIRGLVLQDREPATMEAQDTQESDNSFVRENYRYKARMRRVAGYGRWQKLIKVNNT